jgi:Glycosyltransferase family 92
LPLISLDSPTPSTPDENDERWQQFLRWAARARANPRFDAGEREYRLAVARLVGEILAAAGSDESIAGPIESLNAFMRRQRNPQVLLGKQFGQLMKWTEQDERGLALALTPFIDADVAPSDRIERFVNSARTAIPVQEVGAFGLSIGSLFNFSTAPQRLPILRLAMFSGLEQLLGAPSPPGSVTEVYAHHVGFADRVRDALVGAGVAARDMVDAEALMLICWEDRDFWLAGPAGWRPRPRKADHYLAACAVYRDEAAYLAEWLEFHLLVGFERFYLYDNVSEDDHLAVLEPYLEEGLVVLHDWPMPYVPGQEEAYRHCLANHREEARWIGFFDIDEFLFSPTYRPVSEVLEEYEQWPGVAVNAPRFGTSGHLTKPEGLVIENYVTHMRLDSDRTIKSIVDPAAAETSVGAHVFKFRRGSAVDEHGYPVHYGATKTPSFERLRINHYYWKSVEELTERQTGRTAGPGRAWRAPPTAAEFARFEAKQGVRDEAILPYVEPVREALARRALEA